ncbi:hypothetical protein WM019_03340 [Bifidobacterium mongoliense]|uniref:hypothetical protein n=1 Tax=Bifidobacterium mongoliense TaxID=518643 RepID=UPI0030EC55D1
MGKATTILVGAALVLSGNIGFVTYIMFLLASSIIYMPMSTMFESTTELLLIGTHTARLREINNEPIQAGSSDFHPQGHDIAFDNVTFSYESEKTGVSAGAGSATFPSSTHSAGCSTASSARFRCCCWPRRSGVLVR